MNASANFTWSRNKVKNFSEFIDDYDNGTQQINKYNKTDIAYSPAVVSAATINFLPCKNWELSLQSKYAAKQYLDNTQHADRKLDAFFVQDARISYTIKRKTLKEINIIGQVNNLFNTKYEPNGYTFSYIYGGSPVTENYYFPMAGTNFMIGVNISL
jgi:iron complex outermembrane recepter protein